MSHVVVIGMNMMVVVTYGRVFNMVYVTVLTTMSVKIMKVCSVEFAIKFGNSHEGPIEVLGHQTYYVHCTFTTSTLLGDMF